MKNLLYIGGAIGILILLSRNSGDNGNGNSNGNAGGDGSANGSGGSTDNSGRPSDGEPGWGWKCSGVRARRVCIPWYYTRAGS